MRTAAVVLGALRGVGELAIAVVGLSIGGPDTGIVIGAIAGVIGGGGAVVVASRPLPAAVMFAIGAIGAGATIYRLGLLQVLAAGLLLLAAAAALRLELDARRAR